MLRKNRKFSEWVSFMLAKNPAAVILIGILWLNMATIFLSALIISYLAPASLQQHGFWASVYYTISMILDAGCISYVVEDVGQTSVALIFVCIITVLVGSVTFTGAVIGYLTNYISEFIGASNSGERQLRASNHTIILNWNSRGSEIVNDLLYTSGKRELVVILVSEGRARIESEIHERLANTLDMERRLLLEEVENKKLGFFAAYKYYKMRKLHNKVTVIVREGDTFSTQKLNDISIKRAKTVIILGKDIQNSVCKYENKERKERSEKGNTNTIKTLIQVADLTGSSDSVDNQKIVVETEDEWTLALVRQIIFHKEKEGKCNIVPLTVNRILGQILSQFSIMPELNMAYGDLFSNKGAAFFSQCADKEMQDPKYVHRYMEKTASAIPLVCMESDNGKKKVPTFYYLATSEADIAATEKPICRDGLNICVDPDYKMDRKYIIVLGHNSKSSSIMAGFESFSGEWNYDPNMVEDPQILKILMIDDQKSLEKANFYQNYPQVVGYKAADIFAKDDICNAINEFIDSHEGDTSILILSDDTVTNEEMDANALTYLIYVQEIITERMKKDPNMDPKSIDVVVEILNPKNYDIVRSYNIDNIVISNRYLSKMITQIGEKDNLYCFYDDILTYDEPGVESDSKELYVKPVKTFLTSIPERCTAAELIRGVYDTSPEDNKCIICGYVDRKGQIQIFSGNQNEIELELCDEDKLIMFSSH